MLGLLSRRVAIGSANLYEMLMTWLFEDGILILTVATVIELLLAVALFQTGRGAVLFAMLGVLAIGTGMMVVEGLVVTDREAVVSLLETSAQAAEDGDIATVVAAVDPKASQIRDELRQMLDRFEVKDINLGDMEVTIDRRANPRRAQATLRVFVAARDLADASPYQSLVVRLAVELEFNGEKWQVVGYRSLEGV